LVVFFGAFALAAGAFWNLYQSMQMSPEGQILKSKDYQYKGVRFKDSIWVYTGSTIILSGSGKMISDEFPVVLEIQYSSGAALTHRKISISTGSLVHESGDSYEIYVGTGYVITDVLTDDGELGLFKEIDSGQKISVVKETGAVLKGKGEWEYVDETEKKVEVTMQVDNEEENMIEKKIIFDAQEVLKQEGGEVELVVAEDSVWEEKTEKVEKHFVEINENIGNNQPSEPDPAESNDVESQDSEEDVIENEEVDSSEDNRWGDDFINSDETEENNQQVDNEEDEDGLYWNQYPDTDEGNYQFALDRMDVELCKRIDEEELRKQCEQEVYEALGRCNALMDEVKIRSCKNMRILNGAVASERISKCSTIVDDNALINRCIMEINQKLYDSAIEAQDINICNAIYNSGMQADCLMRINN